MFYRGRDDPVPSAFTYGSQQGDVVRLGTSGSEGYLRRVAVQSTCDRCPCGTDRIRRIEAQIVETARIPVVVTEIGVGRLGDLRKDLCRGSVVEVPHTGNHVRSSVAADI